MKTSLFYFSIILIAAFSSSCGKSFEYNGACGELKTFTVDKNYCEKYGLYEKSFTVKYPSDLEIETQEDYESTNYVSFFKYDEDSLISESVNIGYYYGLSESGGDGLLGGLLGLTKESLITQLVNQLKAQGLPLKNVTMKDENIRGESHFTTRAEFQTTENVAGLKGAYLIQLVMIATESDNGVLMIMMAREDSDIKSFEDFDSKGCLAPVLNSLN